MYVHVFACAINKECKSARARFVTSLHMHGEHTNGELEFWYHTYIMLYAVYTYIEKCIIIYRVFYNVQYIRSTFNTITIYPDSTC